MRCPGRRTARLVILLLACTYALPARADDRRVSELESQLAEQSDRIGRLEALVERQTRLLETLQGKAADPAAPHPAPSRAASPADGADRFRIAGLDVSGDLRIREEFNFSDADARDRTRTVFRARLRAAYRLGDHFAVGGQLTTGDPDDPNSTDVTLGNFADDLDVSLDQAWIRYQAAGITAWAG